jgi:hypothetical protein
MQIEVLRACALASKSVVLVAGLSVVLLLLLLLLLLMPTSFPLGTTGMHAHCC